MLAVMAASLPSPWHCSVQLCPSRVRAMFVGCRMLLLMKSGWEVEVQAPSHHSNTRVRLEALWSHCPSAQLCAEQRQSPWCLQITPSWCCWAAVLAHSRNISGTRQALKKNMVSSDSSRKLSSCQTTNKLEAFPSLILLDIRPEPSSFFSSSPKRFSMRPSICLIPSCTERPVLTLAWWKSNDIWDSKAAKMRSCDGSEGKKTTSSPSGSPGWILHQTKNSSRSFWPFWQKKKQWCFVWSITKDQWLQLSLHTWHHLGTDRTMGSFLPLDIHTTLQAQAKAAPPCLDTSNQGFKATSTSHLCVILLTFLSWPTGQPSLQALLVPGCAEKVVRLTNPLAAQESRSPY